MEDILITFVREGITIPAKSGQNLLALAIELGIWIDAVCNGQGTCGKCSVWIEGQKVPACKTVISRSIDVVTEVSGSLQTMQEILLPETITLDNHEYCLAFDIGTTTLAAYLLSGETGKVLAQESLLNPQTKRGADVISRMQYAMEFGQEELMQSVRVSIGLLAKRLCEQCSISIDKISIASFVGNTAMHHLLLGITPDSLVVPPYMPKVSAALQIPTFPELPLGKHGMIRIPPNIAGFVGSDTVAGMMATNIDKTEDLTLLIDIGTNGEMVLGNRHKRIACSTAAGPAFEGARISCGMRAIPGAIDHVYLENGKLQWHVMGELEAKGLCGSGLLDLMAVLLEMRLIDESGLLLHGKEYRLQGTPVVLTQKDIREVQLAKAAIRAGIELMASVRGINMEDIAVVNLAGAFGNYLDPATACGLGMIPKVLLGKIRSIGNAAGYGACLCAVSAAEFERSKIIAKDTEFLELAKLPAFQDCFISSLALSEEPYEF